MTPGPSSMPQLSPQATHEGGDPLSASVASSSAADSSPSQPRPSEGGSGQPKTCVHCGQQLDNFGAVASASDPAPSMPAPSPSSIAFAPDGLLHQNGDNQPQSSLTSAINAAAAAALSRHLAASSAGPSVSGSADGEAHAICSRCSAASEAPAPDEFRARLGPRSPISASQGDQSDLEMPSSAHSTHTPLNPQEPGPDLAAVATRQEARQHTRRPDHLQRPPSHSDLLAGDHTTSISPATRAAAASASPAAPATTSRPPTGAASTDPLHIPGSSTASAAAAALPASPPRRQAPWATGPRSPTSAAPLSINVGNMGAGGDAVGPYPPSTDDPDFPPLSRAATSPTLRSPTSPGRSPTRERGRLRFVPGSPPNSSSRIPTLDEHATAAPSSSPFLARSGSFSRSLSYNVASGHDASTASPSGAAPIVSFPPAAGYQPALGTSPPAGRLRRSSSSSSGINVPAPAGAIPGAARVRRPSVTRRLSRSSSSTGPTSIPFAAVGMGASATDFAGRYAIEEDPFGPSSMTRPRLSTIPTHAISDSLAASGPSRGYVLTAPMARSTSGRDDSSAGRTLPNPLRFPYSRSCEGQGSGSDAAAMEVDPVPAARQDATLASKIRVDQCRWYDPLRPDPLMELSRLRSPPKGRGCLFPGAVFNGTQKSGRNSYDNVDMENSHLCGYLNIRGLTEDWPELTTYFDAEIIGDRHGFVTGKWGATEADDLKHWARFPPFRPLRSGLTKPGLKFSHHNKPYVFMRWKERFLVPDHRVRDINGASFAGFYYVCVELGGDTARRPTHTPVGGFGATSPSSEYPFSHDGATAGGGGWYAATTRSTANRRRELSVGNAAASSSIWPSSPSSPPPASSSSPVHPSGAGSANKDRNDDDMRDERMSPHHHQQYRDDIEEGISAGKMLGFYFHENSEPYQQLSLHHVHERSTSGFEMR
ncbi:uncharacterized protein PSFLO_00130 [Pseudozyma flocculosa]|uniref:Uncharacterized protein n=1 Tax=Pseudozyma flocculosa TaxID=84751 RepID=A0A5C3EUA7_9BASI|nr:uncharacterized protein PSFLO_00130 [Pseudozyma flocculosa]